MSAQIGYSEKTIRIVQFSGKRSDWRMWSKQFLAISAKKRYKDVILGTATVPPEADDFGAGLELAEGTANCHPEKLGRCHVWLKRFCSDSALAKGP